MATEKHTIYGGKVHLYRRAQGGNWQCSAYVAGKNRRQTTGEKSLTLAKEFAEDWYLSLKGQVRDGFLRDEKSFKDAALQFKREFSVITEGQRNPNYVKTMMGRIDNYLIPFFGSYGLSQITGGLVQEYRVWRQSYSVPRHNVIEQPQTSKVTPLGSLWIKSCQLALIIAINAPAWLRSSVVLGSRCFLLQLCKPSRLAHYARA